MGNALVKDYVEERDRHLNTINVLQAQAKERGGDPTEQELEAIDKAKLRVKAIDKIVDTIGEDLTMDEDTREKLLRAGRDSTPSAPKYRSAGELMWDVVHATFGNQHEAENREARERYDRVMKRTAQHMGTAAELTTPTAGGFGGLYVAPVIGPVIDIAPQGQPFLRAIGKQQAPNSVTFSRPRIVDPDFKTGAAKQTLQKAELQSRKFDVKIDTLSLETYGGYLNVSQQLLSLHPGAWDIIVTQMNRRVAWQGEAAAIAELSDSEGEVPLATGADSDVVLAALVDAAVKVYENTQQFPTWIAFGPLGWATLAKLVDDVKRPLFPFLAAQNAMGTSGLGDMSLGPLGLQQILTPGITTVDIWLGNDLGLEAYAYQFPVLESVEPSVFGRQIAVAEALAFYRPTTLEGDPAEGAGAVRVGPASE